MIEEPTVLTIEKLVSKGEGLARCDNKVWFIPMTVPGEEILATPITQKKQFIKGELLKVLTPSIHRVPPFCSHYGICGGCDFQHIEYREQVRIKESIILENIERIGKIDTKSIKILPSLTGDDTHYRQRVRFSIDPRSQKIGFLSRNTHDVVDIQSCPLLSPSLNNLLRSNKDVLLRTARDTNQGIATVSAFEGDEGIVTIDDTIVEVSLLNISLKVNAKVFFQSNQNILKKMAILVREWTVGETVVDLYSGIGTFASLVEGDSRKVYAVERDEKCISLAQKHLRTSTFITQDATKWMKNRTKEKVDTLIVDPPRVGLDPSMVENISILNPTHFIYISCDSATFSRDASLLEKVGYKIDTFVCVDMYPHTSHTETMALLKRT